MTKPVRPAAPRGPRPSALEGGFNAGPRRRGTPFEAMRFDHGGKPGGRPR